MFYLSPSVMAIEEDWSATVQAVASAVGVCVLENTERGEEMSKILISNTDELIKIFGKPTNNKRNYISMLTAVQALSEMNVLYCTSVKPEDATFAGLYSIVEEDPVTQENTHVLLPLSDKLNDPNEKAYNLKSFKAGNISQFNEEVEPKGFADVIALSRGAWGNRIRVAFINKTIYDKVVRKSDQATIASCKYAQALRSLDLPIQNDDEFIVIVQYLRDISLNPDKPASWDLVEAFIMSTGEKALDPDGHLMFAESVINRSQFIRLTLNEFQKNVPFTHEFLDWFRLGGGSDGSLNASMDAEIISAYRLYDNAEEFDVNVIIDGGKSETVKKEIIKICEERKDCMGILDVPENLVLFNRGFETTDLVDWRKGLGKFELADNMNESTDRVAIYANWVEVYDIWNKKFRWIPSSGFAAAVWARTDESTDPWFAPAGLTRGQLHGVRKLAFNPSLGERDMLYSAGLNPIVAFAKEGKVIWGQKTLLDSTSSFNRINVRRLFLVLEKSIATFARRYLFEPNDEFTQRLIKGTIDPYLTDVKARRGIYDFLVICDSTNNTPARIDRGELWCDIRIKPVRSAEFIILRFSNTNSGMSFEEIIELESGSYNTNV